MSFQEAIKQFFVKYATFDGRASRSEYWWAILFVVLVSSAAEIIDPSTKDHSSVVGSLWSLAVLVPSLAAGTRRLHDMGRKGTSLFWLLLPVVGWIMVIVWLTQASIANQEATGLKSV